MVRAWLGVGIIFMALLGLCGCGKDPPVEVQPQSGLERAKVILNDYANGAPSRFGLPKPRPVVAVRNKAATGDAV